jgi:ribosomal protein S18 acetylase RimI-like enzyme
MKFSISRLADLPPSAIPALADLHLATMPTLLADLGRPVVLRYYQLAQKDPSVIGICASDSPLPVGEGAGVRAYALGSPNPSALNAQLRSPLPWFAGQMLHVLFTRPSALWQMVISMLSSSSDFALKPGQIELTYIGVALEARGQGLGKTLLAAFVDTARAAGYTSIVLSVEIDNPAALALYTKFGFQIIKTFTEGRYRRHRMQFDL